MRTASWAALVPLLLCGCLGVQTALPSEKVVSAHHLCPCAGERPTADALTRQWGRPDSIEKDGSDELWHFSRGDMRWVGVTLYLVVMPIPLRVPAGGENVTVRFHDGELVSAVRNDVDEHTYWCTLMFGPCTVPGCESF